MADKPQWSLTVGVGAQGEESDLDVAVIIDGHRILMGSNAARHLAQQLTAWADHVDKVNEQDKEKGNAQER